MNTTVTYTIYDFPNHGDTTDYTKEEFQQKFEAVDSEPASREHGTLGLTGIALRHEDGKYYSFLKTVEDENGRYV
jgi:hypothetical protein